MFPRVVWHPGRVFVRAIAGVVLIVLLIGGARAKAQLNPASPRVKQAVKRALEFLEQQNESRMGAKALVGLTFVKAGKDESHPKVKEALAAVQAQAKRGAENISVDIYSTGISIMFLVALNPSRYRSEIEAFVGSLHRRQKPPGAWGYPRSNPNNGETCDTSMTQYAVLGLWEAEDQAGVETPAAVWDQAARWLLRTQDPSGGFGYQGKPAYEIGERIKQSGVRHSLTVAAMGSLYIVKDRVGYRRLKKKFNDGLPSAFELIEEEQPQEVKTDIPLRAFGRVIGSGNRWIEDNYDVSDLKTWIHYSLYALERYDSLRQADADAANIAIPKSERTKWYMRGARYLLKTQEADGHWDSNAGPGPDTCFGALFLMGSTRKTLQTTSAVVYRGGQWVGGRGIPATDKVRVRDGKLVVAPVEAPLQRVLQILLSGRLAGRASAVEALADASVGSDAEELRKHGAELEQLAAGDDVDVARLAIVALRRAEAVGAVPLLIALVEEGEPELMDAAADALAHLTRTGDRHGLTTESDAAERRNAAEKWRQWYRQVRPSGRKRAGRP